MYDLQTYNYYMFVLRDNNILLGSHWKIVGLISFLIVLILVW